MSRPSRFRGRLRDRKMNASHHPINDNDNDNKNRNANANNDDDDDDDGDDIFDFEASIRKEKKQQQSSSRFQRSSSQVMMSPKSNRTVLQHPVVRPGHENSSATSTGSPHKEGISSPSSPASALSLLRNDHIVVTTEALSKNSKETFDRNEHPTNHNNDASSSTSDWSIPCNNSTPSSSTSSLSLLKTTNRPIGNSHNNLKQAAVSTANTKVHPSNRKHPLENTRNTLQQQQQQQQQQQPLISNTHKSGDSSCSPSILSFGSMTTLTSSKSSRNGANSNVIDINKTYGVTTTTTTNSVDSTNPNNDDFKSTLTVQNKASTSSFASSFASSSQPQSPIEILASSLSSSQTSSVTTDASMPPPPSDGICTSDDGPNTNHDTHTTQRTSRKNITTNHDRKVRFASTRIRNRNDCVVAIDHNTKSSFHDDDENDKTNTINDNTSPTIRNDTAVQRPPLPPSSSITTLGRQKYDNESVTTTVKKANTTIKYNSASLSNGDTAKRNIFQGTNHSTKWSTVSPSGGTFHHRRPQYGERTRDHNTKLISTIAGTTTDIYAIQDKGNYEMLCDECIYLCHNILQQSNHPTSMPGTTTTIIRWMEQRIPMLRTCFSTAVELAYLLSSKKNRRTLFLRPQSKQHCPTDNTNNATNHDPLTSVLNVFAWMSSFIQCEMTHTALNSLSHTPDMDTTTRITGHDDDGNGGDDDDHRKIPSTNSTYTGRLSHHTGTSPSDVSNVSLKSTNTITNEMATVSAYSTLRQRLLDALGMCVYFVSFDCTLSDDSLTITGSSSSSLSGSNTSSAAASKVARRIRNAILCHDGCIRGILHLIISDPFIQHLRGTDKHNHVERVKDGEPSTVDPSLSQLNSPLPSIRVTKESIAVTTSTSTLNENVISTTYNTGTPTSVTSSIPSRSPSLTRRNDMVAQTPDESVDSTDSIDPTLIGRLRRKRRRLEQQQQQKGEFSRCDDDISFCGMEGKDDTLLNGDNLSFTSKSPSPVSKQWNNSCTEDISITSSNDSNMMKVRDKMDHVTSLIYDQTQPIHDNENDNEYSHLSGKSNRFAKRHSCNRAIVESMTYTISSVLPLLSLTRIITGKMEGSDESCMDDDDGQGNDRESDHDEYNPLLESNRMLNACGAIPLLSQALSESLAVVSCRLELVDAHTMVRLECPGCINALTDRVAALVQLIDGASLLSSSNREQFCLEGYTNEAGGYLIIALLTVLTRKLNENNDQNVFDGVWDEVILAILKMLTSLTHENMTAARELEAPLVQHDSSIGMRSAGTDENTFCGVIVIAQVLQHASKQILEARSSFSPHQDGKLLYDAIIFCLNILANFVESGGSCRILAKISTLKQHTGAGNNDYGGSYFLQWLTRWLVDETVSFREAVVESTFGSSPSKHQDRQLDALEDEKLVIAGNGFVLLCCLLIEDDNGNEKPSVGTSESVTNIILDELPGTNCDSKLTFMKNTLKAFCNFYHFSIGDLSLAIVAPVKQLIKRLDNRFDDKVPEYLEVSD